MKNINGVIGIIITLIFLALAFSNINFAEIAFWLGKADPHFIALASFFYMSSFIFRGIRWKLMIRAKKSVKLVNSFSYVVIGWMGNNILPARAGEMLRAYVSGKKEGLGTPFSLGTIIAERLFDVFTLLTFLFALIVFSPFPKWVSEAGIAALSLLLILLSLIAYIIRSGGGPLRRLKFVEKRIDSFISGIKVMDKKSVLPIYALTILSWLSEALVFYSVAIATGLEISFYMAVFALTIVNIGIAIPSSPGYVGTFHFLTILALGVFAIDKNAALGFAILVHLSEYIPTTLSGIFLLQRQKIGLMEFRRK